MWQNAWVVGIRETDTMASNPPKFIDTWLSETNLSRIMLQAEQQATTQLLQMDHLFALTSFDLL